MSTTDTISASSEKVYYSGTYWNDYPLARIEINRRATGNGRVEWYDHFFKLFPGPYKKVLVLNCGNGWVERRLIEKGYINSALGVDYSPTLLAEARKEAGSLPLKYYRMDINTAKFPEADFDLIINHAAAHHIAKVNKVFEKLLEIITNNGLLVNFDYVGPHRNQYPPAQWLALHSVNAKLEKVCQQKLEYPHQPTMLVTDPSEAIHSELVLPIMKRYFDWEYFKPIGGAIAYPLLTHNQALLKAPVKKQSMAIKRILEADKQYLMDNPGSTMFAYWVAKPHKAVLTNHRLLRAYQKEEDEREKTAKTNQGRYYQPDLMEGLYLELSDLRLTKQHKQAAIEELQRKNDELSGELDALKSRKFYRVVEFIGRYKK